MTAARTEIASRFPVEHDDQEALRDFFEIYDAHRDEISKALEAWAAQHSELGPLLDAVPADVREEQARVSRDLMRGAVFEGRWDDYLSHLRDQGCTTRRPASDSRRGSSWSVASVARCVRTSSPGWEATRSGCSASWRR
jgi:hypothetical protein